MPEAAWPDTAARLFNPAAQITAVPLAEGQSCIVIDDVLAEPERLVQWAAARAFAPPQGFPYPGLLLDAPAVIKTRLMDYFTQHLRGHFGVRRTLDLTARLSLVTTPPQALDPRQWQCHRDRIAAEPAKTLFAASVLYLFRNPALGGTSFYVPRQPRAQTEQLIGDSQTLSAEAFSARYGLQAGYMLGSNDYFERIASVPAAWNRLIVYDGGLFHSADIAHPELLSEDPRQGRLSLNGFFTCQRQAR